MMLKVILNLPRTTGCGLQKTQSFTGLLDRAEISTSKPVIMLYKGVETDAARLEKT
jgi:hypothetical protein